MRTNKGAAPKSRQPPAPREGNWRRYKAVVSLSMDHELLARIDAMAQRKHLTRAALIALWTGERLEQEEARVP